MTTESALPQSSDAASVHLETAPTLTERLADYVVGLRLEDVPAEVVEAAKERLVHHLGLALRANGSEHGTERGQQGIRVARLLSRAGGDTTIIGQPEKAAALDAVFANSMLIVGMDDGLPPPTGAHPGVVILPVALAIAERQRSTGGEFLTAVVAGYDVLGKLARSSFAWNAPQPRRPNEIFAPLGIAATAARLMALSREETAHALAHAANMSMGIVEGTAVFHWINPLLTRNGLMAATMAKAGLPMWPLMLEGSRGLFRSFYGSVPERLEAILAELGRKFEIPNTIIKRNRWTGFNNVAIELATDLVTRYSIKPSDIAAVTLVLPVERREREEVYAPGRRTAGARFLLALVLTDGQLTDERYDAEPTSDVIAVLDRIRLAYEDGRPILYTRVEIALRDGRRVVAEGDTWGREHFVFPRAEWGDWLRDCAHGVISSEQVARLERLIVGLDGVDDMKEVIACLVPDSGPTGVPAA